MSTVGTYLLTASDVRELLDIRACIDAVEDAFRALANDTVIAPAVLASHVDGGGFHVKTAGIRSERSFYAMKVNANFPANPMARGLPTVQGVVALFDAVTGEVLALMDSIEITGLRTAAASAVAARHLARPDAHRLTIIGCGVQGAHHARAMLQVRPLTHINLHDVDRAKAVRLAASLAAEFNGHIEIVDDHRAAAREADVVVTCTVARTPILDVDDLPSGGFVAAVGADSETKQEVSSTAMARCAVVVDILDQCAAFGDLHHAIDAGTMTRDDVRADLAAVVSGRARDRVQEGETILFDSTGTALEDVAAAMIVYERAMQSDRPRIVLGS
jgi:ornithine cyclodeaminase/alanine dehydrogenase-like protein (mu-crystallin family)